VQSAVESSLRSAPTRRGYAQIEPEARSIHINNNNANEIAPADGKDERDLICRVQDAFRVFARQASAVLGTAWAFVIAIGIIVVWAATGHFFSYSDTWQLIINTGTTIVTFLMVFLIQNTQNRDSKAVHLKLDELIRAVGGARNHMVDLERLSDQELHKLQKEFERIGKKADETKARVAEVQEEIASR
jgi:low affinity Fe/Cu permease